MNTALVSAQEKLDRLDTALSLEKRGWMSRLIRGLSDTAYDFFGKGRDLRVRDLMRREAEVGIKNIQLELWEQDLTNREAGFDGKMTKQFENLAQEVANAKAVIEQADLAKRRVGQLELQARELVEMNGKLRKAHDLLTEQVTTLYAQADSLSGTIRKAEQARVDIRELRLRSRLIRQAVKGGEARLEQLKQEEAVLTENIAALLRLRDATLADAIEKAGGSMKSIWNVGSSERVVIFPPNEESTRAGEEAMRSLKSPL